MCFNSVFFSSDESHVILCGKSVGVVDNDLNYTKRIQPARGWCATVGGTVQIVSASPEAGTPIFFRKPTVRPRSMAGGAPTPCGRH